MNHEEMQKLLAQGAIPLAPFNVADISQTDPPPAKAYRPANAFHVAAGRLRRQLAVMTTKDDGRRKKRRKR